MPSMFTTSRPLNFPAESMTVAVSGTFYRRRAKRAIDLCGTLVLLLLLSPLLLSIWLTLRASLGPGVVLRQRRIGHGGVAFDCFKFRTMDHDRRRTAQPAPPEGGDRRVGHKRDDDPRHTPLGRALRRYSLDELPQLCNVLLGDMSLIGPRPELEGRCDDEFRAHVRHTVRPGLTGAFQTSSLRSTATLAEGVDADEAYVVACSLRADALIALRTVRALVAGTGR
jgi:lipopolysaccharide/colanic/teichoic acid biosynthesis glycosyltransferase